MSARSLRRAAAVLAGCAAVLGPVGAAQASDARLRATVRKGVPQIVRSQAKILNGLANYQQTHSAGALIRAINAQDRTLTALETKIASQSATSATGRRAKSEIVTGLQLIIASNATLVSQLQRKAAGQPVSTAKLKAAVKADVKGNQDLSTGSKLLKL